MIDITVGHTPDADDAFMFYGISSGKIKSSEFRIKHVVEDIETLNKFALSHELSITAVSAHAYVYLNDYVILSTGGSFGLNYGPVVLAKKRLSHLQLKNSTIAIPGKMTTANLLLKLALGTFKEKEMHFQIIPEAILDGEVDAGLIIHEAQITYDRSKFYKVLDLGAWWGSKTNRLPVPLGINVASNRLMTSNQIKSFHTLLKDSILYGLENTNDAVNYAMKYDRGQSKDRITRFIKMYVNDLTIEMGSYGMKSLTELFGMAKRKGILTTGYQMNFA